MTMLTDFFADNLEVFNLMCKGLNQVCTAELSYPRILKFSKGSSGFWGISGVIPCPLSLFSKPFDDLIEKLQEVDSDNPQPQINVFITTIRKSKGTAQEYASLLMLGSSDAKPIVIGRTNESDWHPHTDVSLIKRLINDLAGRFISKEHDDFLSKLTNDGNFDTPWLNDEGQEMSPGELLVKILDIYQSRFSIELDLLMMETQVSLLGVSKIIRNTEDNTLDAVKRATKSQEAQYKKLFKDYQKIQVQSNGYKERIKRLEQDLKRLGQQRHLPANNPVTVTDVIPLSEQIESLF